MILVTHGELKMLRGGSIRHITITKGRPRPTAAKAKCRWTVGRDYTVTARATFDQDGNVDQKAESIRCLVVSIAGNELASPEWTLALTIKAKAERPVFLASNPGAQRSDYAFDPSRALHDEPEVLGEDALDIIARLAKEERALKRPDRRPWAA